ncbi:MAG TPA: hypothetical protein VK982_12200, partial [Bacteroidales bacterium]|nr:hypothetical protein [Bacteroidales bacterium]
LGEYPSCHSTRQLQDKGLESRRSLFPNAREERGSGEKGIQEITPVAKELSFRFYVIINFAHNLHFSVLTRKYIKDNYDDSYHDLPPRSISSF